MTMTPAFQGGLFRWLTRPGGAARRPTRSAARSMGWACSSAPCSGWDHSPLPASSRVRGRRRHLSSRRRSCSGCRSIPRMRGRSTPLPSSTRCFRGLLVTLRVLARRRPSVLARLLAGARAMVSGRRQPPGAGQAGCDAPMRDRRPGRPVRACCPGGARDWGVRSRPAERRRGRTQVPRRRPRDLRWLVGRRRLAPVLVAGALLTGAMVILAQVAQPRCWPSRSC